MLMKGAMITLQCSDIFTYRDIPPCQRETNFEVC